MCAASVSVQADEVTGQSNTLSLPRPAWKFVAQAAVGACQSLVLVSGTPRDLKTLTALPPCRLTRQRRSPSAPTTGPGALR